MLLRLHLTFLFRYRGLGKGIYIFWQQELPATLQINDFKYEHILNILWWQIEWFAGMGEMLKQYLSLILLLIFRALIFEHLVAVFQTLYFCFIFSTKVRLRICWYLKAFSIYYFKAQYLINHFFIFAINLQFFSYFNENIPELIKILICSRKIVFVQSWLKFLFKFRVWE